TLRNLVRIGTLDVRAAAAIALTRLGDFETVELSRHWISPAEPPVLRIAAARILSAAHADGGSKAINVLLGDPSTVSAGIDLALEAPSPALVPELSRLLRSGDSDRADDLVAAIRRAGGDAAVRVLEDLFEDAMLGPVAAHALARMPGNRASPALARLL